MKVGTKVTWLAVVVVGVFLGSGTLLFGREFISHPPLVPLGLILVQLAALLLPMYRSRELRADAKSRGQERGPTHQR
ncbi:MAG TPA: hypothetical protein VK458_17795 [Myxococcaceae bacterium]|nr:hypothetical protein [Myxococcaceae bacterium]